MVIFHTRRPFYYIHSHQSEGGVGGLVDVDDQSCGESCSFEMLLLLLIVTLFVLIVERLVAKPLCDYYNLRFKRTAAAGGDGDERHSKK